MPVGGRFAYALLKQNSNVPKLLSGDYIKCIDNDLHWARSLWAKSLGTAKIAEQPAKQQQKGSGNASVRSCIRELDLDQLIDDPANFASLASLLRRYGRAQALYDGRHAHAYICRRGFDQNTFLVNCLVQMYGSCGSTDDARAVFDRLSNPNVYSWTIIITAYSQNENLEDARNMFARIRHQDVVTWNAMITAFAQNGHAREALDFFKEMRHIGIKPDNITFVSALDACAGLKALEEGQEIHAIIDESQYGQDLVVCTALINMYGKCGSVCDAWKVFDNLRYRDIVAWNAMLAAFSQNDFGKETLDLFREMHVQGFKPDNITFVSALDACASLAALQGGQEVHAIIVGSWQRRDTVLGTALINMYGKCACVQDARRVFNCMPRHDAVSWNAMIATHAQNGQAKQACGLFHQMLYQNVTPDKTTFVCVLMACSHAGLVDDGRNLFVSLNRDHGIKQTIDHYVCMIDLLGRSGHLDEAERLTNNVLVVVVPEAWKCLLGACRIHGDVKRGVRVANRCFELDPMDVSPFVILSNIYAEAGRPDDVVLVREALKRYGVKKPGCRSMVLNKIVHYLV